MRSPKDAKGKLAWLLSRHHFLGTAKDNIHEIPQEAIDRCLTETVREVARAFNLRPQTLLMRVYKVHGKLGRAGRKRACTAPPYMRWKRTHAAKEQTI